MLAAACDLCELKGGPVNFASNNLVLLISTVLNPIFWITAFSLNFSSEDEKHAWRCPVDEQRMQRPVVSSCAFTNHI